ncbi:hypothetical protein F5X98DRAFT_380332 [Xylaria grammica]|nr:hypothetical protein F5X98DRAFT_380332 [Xylaria grammica]
MPSASRLRTLIGFLGLGVKSANGGALHHDPHHNTSSHSTTISVTRFTTHETYPTSSVTTLSPTTSVSTSTIQYPTINPNLTITVSVPETVTVSVPETITASVSETVTVSVPETITHNSTIYYPTVVPTTSVTTVTIGTSETITRNSTVQYPTIVPTTILTTVTVPTTVVTPSVSYSTYIPTITTSENEECPTTCSVVASTVRLFFWPTSNDYTYPSTYVSTGLDYTFTSPSVYLVISTLYGTNSVGRAGPSGTNQVFPLDLDQVSTVIPGGQITQQLTLNDLRTDCPQSEDPEVIATTIPDGHCDFSLLAPQPVKQWALPCNACGRLGLFDPPYAIPPLDGGITETATTTSVDTTTFVSTTSASSGPTTTIITATSTATATTATSQSTETETTSSTGDPTTVSSSPTTGPTTIPTGSASRVTSICGAAWLLVTCLVIFCL